LFCERIFGPIKDYECLCNEYVCIYHKDIHKLLLVQKYALKTNLKETVCFASVFLDQ
jgi:DNA-directed RNA polymerase beta' subunit